MSEVATTILHNIGNILNSSNISLNVLKEDMSQPYYDKLFKVVNMIRENLHDLATYITHDSKGN